MVLMALSALVHRSAMGGNTEYAVFNLGRTEGRSGRSVGCLEPAGWLVAVLF